MLKNWLWMYGLPLGDWLIGKVFFSYGKCIAYFFSEKKKQNPVGSAPDGAMAGRLGPRSGHRGHNPIGFVLHRLFGRFQLRHGSNGPLVEVGIDLGDNVKMFLVKMFLVRRRWQKKRKRLTDSDHYEIHMRRICSK